MAKKYIPGRGWVEDSSGGSGGGTQAGFVPGKGVVSRKRPSPTKRSGFVPGRGIVTESPSGGGSSKPGSGGKKNASSPVSSAARAKADKAQASAKRYAQVQRAANKAKRAVLSRKGPQDLAGRTQRDMDLKRMRELQKGAKGWKDKARSEGLRFGGDTPRGNRPPDSPAATNPQGSGASSGGGTAAGKAVTKATSGGGSSTGKGGGAPKVGAVLSRARKMKQETTGTPISAKELKSFMAYYAKTHKGSLSRSDAVLMARLLKSKSPGVAKKYGLNVATEG